MGIRAGAVGLLSVEESRSTRAFGRLSNSSANFSRWVGSFSFEGESPTHSCSVGERHERSRERTQAAPPYTCTTVYYSQPDYWDVVGEDTLTCSGKRIQTGTTSPYYETYAIPATSFHVRGAPEGASPPGTCRSRGMGRPPWYAG
jgi:hypothetical protein